jgi:rhodanese-related sulfurtransferase
MTMLKKLLLLALLTSTAVFAQDASKPANEPNGGHHAPATKAKQLTNEEFDGYLAHPEQVLIIDVRRPDEVSNIGGFPVYLSIQAKELKSHLGEIPKDRAIITVSNHAARASVAADLLESNGFKVLGAIGADTYQKSGGKLAAKIPVPPASPGAQNGAARSNAHAGTTGSN